ncbi:MAG TPA: lysophospholipid acyltransferase family protein [Alphaproteobacteria bacterium]|nr:lysophospholipid acyltransferase family protein [Alphaproteobacteria bacterium]
MLFLRSLAFNVAFIAWTAIVTIGCLPALLLPRGATFAVSRFWARGVLGLLAVLVGLRHEVRGADRLPNGPVIYAVKHQSAWETIAFALLIPRFAGVFKRELLRIPIYGWYLWRAAMIPIDRGAGAGALRKMLRKARATAAEGRSIVVMPEGTRVAPGGRRYYHSGIAALYLDLGLPVVPVALNSGYFWGRRAFIKQPGTIVFALLEPIAPGLDRKEFMVLLKQRIEDAAEALAQEARAQLGKSGP